MPTGTAYSAELRQLSNEGRRKSFGSTHGQIAFVCECARSSCYDTVLMRAAEFDELRHAGDSVLAVGHPVPVPAA